MKRTHPDDGLNAVSGGLQNDNKSDGILFFLHCCRDNPVFCLFIRSHLVNFKNNLQTIH